MGFKAVEDNNVKTSLGPILECNAKCHGLSGVR